MVTRQPAVGPRTNRIRESSGSYDGHKPNNGFVEKTTSDLRTVVETHVTERDDDPREDVHVHVDGEGGTMNDC